MNVKPNMHYAIWLKVMKGQPAMLKPWAGYAFRFASLQFCQPTQILDGVGSYKYGARYNATGSFKAAYHSLTKATAVAESDANAAHYGLERDKLRPRLLVAVECRLQRVLDLTDARVRRSLGVNLEVLRKENWRELRDTRLESRTQALGRAAFDLHAEGMLAPSACAKNGVNLVLFPENILVDSLVRICNADELKHLKH